MHLLVLDMGEDKSMKVEELWEIGIVALLGHRSDPDGV